MAVRSHRHFLFNFIFCIRIYRYRSRMRLSVLTKSAGDIGFFALASREVVFSVSSGEDGYDAN